MSIRYVVEIREKSDEFARRFAFNAASKAEALKARIEREGGWASQVYTRPTAELLKEAGYLN